jgi:hypothetical protein
LAIDRLGGQAAVKRSLQEEPKRRLRFGCKSQENYEAGLDYEPVGFVIAAMNHRLSQR